MFMMMITICNTVSLLTTRASPPPFAFAFTTSTSSRVSPLRYSTHKNYDYKLQPSLQNYKLSKSSSTSPSSPIYDSNTKLHAIPPINDMIPVFEEPFKEFSKNLFEQLDIGASLSRSSTIPEAATSMVLESLGRDLLVFLAASVVVTPVAMALGITPILGYLIAGAILGPHALDIFSNTKADVELGDFGILFLLFSEGLEVTKARLDKLTNYLPLGVAQISLTAGVLTGAILFGLPQLLGNFIPLDVGLIDIKNPVEALVLALAGTLSTSAFVFPVLKEKEWEEEASGEAATSVLLLQDLAVAPLLVLLPFLVGQGAGDGPDYGAIGFLTAKATLGFGTVVYLGSIVLRRVFKIVAQARSSETFVALCLLVSVGMGAIAKSLGLTDTAGAFAAGVLLANSNYKAQVQADILPFKGILLGIFFMDAGSSFDLELVISEFPTILTGALALVACKAATLYAATQIPERFEPNRLPEVDAVRIAFLLAGGGEFAFVVLALAEKLNVLPVELGSLLTAIVLITMAVTPVLGDFAESYTQKLMEKRALEPAIIEDSFEIIEVPESDVASDSVVVAGYGEIGSSVLRVIGENASIIPESKDENNVSLPNIVAFDNSPNLADKLLMPSLNTLVLYGDGSNPEVLRSSGIIEPYCIFVTYHDHSQVVSATSRLRNAFRKSPIYARAQTRAEAQVIEAAGATSVVVEGDELSRSTMPLMRGKWAKRILKESSKEELRKTVAAAADISPEEVDNLLDLFSCMDRKKTGVVDPRDIASLIRNSNIGVYADDEIEQLESWVFSMATSKVDSIEFCKLYVRAPEHVKEAMGNGCLF